jgi:integrase/recombinase XerC
VGNQRLNSRFLPAATRSVSTLGWTSTRSAAPTSPDARFGQQQVGHEHASTTSIYTCVSSDYRTRTLRRHLDATTAAALATQTRREA